MYTFNYDFFMLTLAYVYSWLCSLSKCATFDSVHKRHIKDTRHIRTRTFHLCVCAISMSLLKYSFKLLIPSLPYFLTVHTLAKTEVYFGLYITGFRDPTEDKHILFTIWAKLGQKSVLWLLPHMWFIYNQHVCFTWSQQVLSFLKYDKSWCGFSSCRTLTIFFQQFLIC